MDALITLVILAIIIKIFTRKTSIVNWLFWKKFNRTVTKHGPQIPLTFNADESEFLYDYLERSEEIAVHNGKVANANMLTELKRKLLKATFDEALVRHNADNNNYREFEANGEFAKTR